MSELQVDHTAHAVTVYPDRARVTSRGATAVTAETTTLLFDELPLALAPDSLRFSGGGTAQVRVLSLDVARRHYAETPSAAAQEIEQQRDAALAALRAVQDEQGVWAAEEAALDGLRAAAEALASGLGRGKTTVAELGDLLAFLQERDRAARAALRELGPQEEAAQRELDKVERELAQVRSQRPRQRFVARVEIEVVEAGDFAAELSYVVREAGWSPLYDVRLDEGVENGRVLDVSILAEVRQQTGQDWAGVALTVSTARPALNQGLPDLEPWYLDAYEAREELLLMADSGEPRRTALAAPMAMNKRAEFVAAEQGASGAVVTYRVAGRSTVASDGAPHKSLLAGHTTQAELTYLAIPVQTTAVYRRAKFANDSGAPLLEGAANLFVNDEYVGRTQIEYTAVGDELELLLGVEERITAERELVRRKVDKRFLRENRLLHYAYDIKLKNLLPHAVEVEVQDQIPVARHEAIKVRLDEVSPLPDEQSELQILTWKLAVDPAAEAQIHFAYTVEYPPTLDVIGLQD